MINYSYLVNHILCVKYSRSICVYHQKYEALNSGYSRKIIYIYIILYIYIYIYIFTFIKYKHTFSAVKSINSPTDFTKT